MQTQAVTDHSKKNSENECWTKVIIKYKISSYVCQTKAELFAQKFQRVIALSSSKVAPIIWFVKKRSSNMKNQSKL